MFDKFECVLEEVRESEEEFQDSPSRKISRGQLAKTKSAELTVVTAAEGKEGGEFEGLKGGTDRGRSTSLRSPSEAEKVHALYAESKLSSL